MATDAVDVAAAAVAVGFVAAVAATALAGTAVARNSAHGPAGGLTAPTGPVDWVAPAPSRSENLCSIFVATIAVVHRHMSMCLG